MGFCWDRKIEIFGVKVEGDLLYDLETRTRTLSERGEGREGREEERGRGEERGGGFHLGRGEGIK